MPNEGVLAVFDGHSKDGADAATIAASNLRGHFLPYFEGDRIMIPNPNLTRHFGELSNMMVGLDGGTTATVVSVTPAHPNGHHRSATVNNVGDSPAYLIDPNDPYSENGILRLTEYHNATNPSEVSRMFKVGSNVVRLFNDYPLYFDAGHESRIAISRSLGAQNIPGIISTPYFDRWYFITERLLLVATDGVLNDETTPDAIEDTLRLYRRRKSMHDIAQELVNKYSDVTGDNATALIAHIPEA